MTASATGTCRGTSGSRARLFGSDAPIEPLRRLNRKLVLLAGRTGSGRLRRRCRRDRRRWPCRKRLFAQLQPFWRQCFDGNEHVGPGRIDRGDLRSQYKCESGLEHSDRTTLGSPETPSSPMRFSVGPERCRAQCCGRRAWPVLYRASTCPQLAALLDTGSPVSA